MLTDKQIDDILSNIKIVVDTREQKNQHIIDYLEKNHIPYVVSKLDSADYSYVLPDYPQLNMDKKVLVEKKNSINEITGNFTKGRKRFDAEFSRIESDVSIHLVIEQATWKKILAHSYLSKMTPKSLTASILSFAERYKMKVWFVGKLESPEIIYRIIYYGLMNKLREV